jgi:DNA-binding transcriptional MerR regulator
VPDPWQEPPVPTIDGQHRLFDLPDDERGFRGPVAAQAAGITYRQLDYWARTGLVSPSLRTATGSGSQRLYTFTDIVALSVVKRLLGTGVSLANIRTALATLHTHHGGDLAGLTLLSDGVGVYLTADDEQIIDLVRGGQAVFGLALGQVATDMHATLTHLPAETTSPPEPSPRPALRVVS